MGFSSRTVKLINDNPGTALAKHMSEIHERLDDWTVEQLQSYVPQKFSVLQLDIGNTEGKVFSLFDRVMARRNELLQLQGQVYLRLAQFDLQVKGRALTTSIIDASTRVEEAAKSAASMRAAADSFGNAEDALPQGFRKQSFGIAESDTISEGKESTRRSAMHSQQTNQTNYEDAVNEIYELERGPFDYSRRYERLTSLYLNDYRSFVDAVQNYVEGVKLLGIDPGAFPSFLSPTFIWEAGEKIQLISRLLYAYRVGRTTRQIVLTIGADSDFDYRFIKEGNGNELSSTEFKDLLAAPLPPTSFPPAPPPGEPFPDPIPNPDQTPWVRLCFSLPEDKRFYEKGRRFDTASDFRLQALGVQWIVAAPYFAEGVTPDEADQNRAREYSMRNNRGIIVPTVLRIPQQDRTRLPPGEAQFPTACTTDDEVERVIANTDPLIVGRSPFGKWEIDIGMPLRKGRKQQTRYKRNAALEQPNILGLILHLAVSARFEG